MKVIAGPLAEPITLDEARLHLRVDPVAGPHPDDPLIDAQLSAAREWAEQYIGQAIAAKTVEIALDEFPCGPIELEGGPVSGIVSVSYVSDAGADVVLPASAYVLDDYGVPCWLLPAYGTPWPATYAAANAVRIRYTLAGTFNPAIRAALLLQLGSLYECRANEDEGKSFLLRFDAQKLLQPYRINLGV